MNHDEEKAALSEPRQGLPERALKWTRTHPLVFIAPLLIATACYAALWMMTSRIRRQAVEYLADSMNSEITVKSVEVTPALRIIMAGVTVTSRDSVLKLPDFRVQRVMLAADVPSLLSGRVKLSEVFVRGAVLTVYQEPDGSYNISRWLDQSSECDEKKALASMPGRINIRDSRVVMEPPPGAHWMDTRELATVEGAVGLTRDGRIAVDLTTSAFNSPVKIMGGMAPCDTRNIAIKGISDMFDFSALRDAVGEMMAGSDWEMNLPGGSGKLSFAMEGNVLSPYITGEVSLQDFDASFSYSEKVLNISDFRSGMGSERISGSGSVHFHSEGIPFYFTLVLENVNLRRLIRRLGDFTYPPDGALSGMLKINGLLEEGGTVIESGDITVTGGTLVIPDPGFSASNPSRPVTAKLHFNELSAKVHSRSGNLRFTGVAITADEWTAVGSAWIDESFLARGLSESIAYNVDMEMESENLPALVAEFPSLRGKAGGAMKAGLKISGFTGTTESMSGSGYAKIMRGFVGNPYSGSSSYSYQAIDFDLAEATFGFGPLKVRISNATIAGDGINIEAEGIVTYEGKMDIRAEALMTPERARDFAGLSRYVAGRDMFTLASYSAKCSITGDFKRPESEWSAPEVTRWDRTTQ